MQIKYTGFRDRPHEERQARFQNACRDGRSEIVSRRDWGVYCTSELSLGGGKLAEMRWDSSL